MLLLRASSRGPRRTALVSARVLCGAAAGGALSGRTAGGIAGAAVGLGWVALGVTAGGSWFEKHFNSFPGFVILAPCAAVASGASGSAATTEEGAPRHSEAVRSRSDTRAAGENGSDSPSLRNAWPFPLPWEGPRPPEREDDQRASSESILPPSSSLRSSGAAARRSPSEAAPFPLSLPIPSQFPFSLLPPLPSASASPSPSPSPEGTGGGGRGEGGGRGPAREHLEQRLGLCSCDESCQQVTVALGACSSRFAGRSCRGQHSAWRESTV